MVLTIAGQTKENLILDPLAAWTTNYELWQSKYECVLIQFMTMTTQKITIFEMYLATLLNETLTTYVFKTQNFGRKKYTLSIL